MKLATCSFQGNYSRKKPEALTHSHTAGKLWGQDVRWKLFRSEPVRIRNKLVWRWFSPPPIIHSQTVFFLFQLITYSNESLVPKCSYAPGSGFPDHFANFVSWVFLLRQVAHHCQLVAAGSGPALVSRARSSHEIHSFSWSTTIRVALSDASQRRLLLW